MAILVEEKAFGTGKDLWRIFGLGAQTERWDGNELAALGRWDVLPPVHRRGTLVIAGRSCSGKSTLAEKLLASVPNAAVLGKRGTVDISGAKFRIEAGHEEARRLWERFRQAFPEALLVVDDAADPELASVAAEEIAAGRDAWVVLSLSTPLTGLRDDVPGFVAGHLERLARLYGTRASVDQGRIGTVLFVERHEERQRLFGWGEPLF